MADPLELIVSGDKITPRTSNRESYFQCRIWLESLDMELALYHRVDFPLNQLSNQIQSKAIRPKGRLGWIRSALLLKAKSMP
jgi:hypothetical protein